VRRRALQRVESIYSRRLEPSTQTGSATEPAVALGRCSGKRLACSHISAFGLMDAPNYPRILAIFTQPRPRLMAIGVSPA